MIQIPFTKLEAQGNDYLFVDDLRKTLPALDYPELARAISDRHFGVGSDGLVVLSAVDNADANMRIFNADGSEAEMCGSALRSTCVLLHQKKAKRMYLVMTGSGLKSGVVEATESSYQVKVDMGMPEYRGKQTVCGFEGHIVDMGNPHFVIFTDSLPRENLASLGSQIEREPFFPRGTNVEFVHVLDDSHAEVIVWERGSGITLACGTGASAVVAAGVTEQLLVSSCEIHLPGGWVQLDYQQSGRHIFLSGSVRQVCSGTFAFEERLHQH